MGFQRHDPNAKQAHRDVQDAQNSMRLEISWSQQKKPSTRRERLWTVTRLSGKNLGIATFLTLAFF